MMWRTKHGHARLNGGEETFPCRTKTKELSDSRVCFNSFLMLDPAPPTSAASAGYTGPSSGSRSWGARGRWGRVRSVSSHKGSCSHLPPYSAQPDPHPQPSPAQQARCLIPTKRLPARGGAVEGGSRGDKGGEELGELGGAPHRDPLTWFPGPAGQTAQTDSTVSTPCLLLSFISHRDPRGRRRDRGGGWRETQREGEGGGANEHNEEADTDYADHLPPSLHSSLGTDLSIPYRQAAALSSSPPCDPSLVCSLL